MYDLDQQISEWRKQMRAAGINTPVPLEELESHLRDEIEQHLAAGENEAEAFAAAVRTIGPARVLEGEFQKIADGKDALRWRFVELGFGLFASVVPLWLGFQVLYPPARSAVDLTPGQQWSSILALLTFAALAWGGRLSCNLFPVVRLKRARTNALLALVPLWWIIFMVCIVPRHDFTMGQFLVAFLWAFMSPGGAMIGFSWGMEAAVRKQNAG
jgi:hypothetical protein